MATPLGASAALVFWMPDAPLSQLHNIILGMVLTKTTHPPGGAEVLFAILGVAEPGFLDQY
ncbi:HPP family protein [Desulfitobacterium sp. AusDCA]|uniref:HPP family protein n=1 Tax=Desulfitobacterium sp. AusDCA TaxID=3240383 RepID=UPI003DA7003D